MEKITLVASDGATIAASYWPGASPRGALLVHMMPATKESWSAFAPQLASRGFHVLAIDLRGHGESAGGPNGFRQFSDVEHQKGRLDMEAGARFLEEKGAADLALLGASIGANLALQYLAEHSEAHAAALLSAGLNYYGLETLPFARMLGAGKKALFVGSEDDGWKSGNCADMARDLCLAVPAAAEKKLIIYHNAGHGTDMFGKEEPDLAEEVLEWVA